MAVKSSHKMKTTVQIPLDYYRILSVPVTATEAQLRQAYEDRLQQKPRREYGEGAIAARQQLIETAYELLTDSQCRTEYNSKFFGNFCPEPRILERETVSESATATVAPTPAELTFANPTIEIPIEQMSGALLILYEMGEYELVLKLGINYLNSVEYAEPSEPKQVKVSDREDIILSLALSYLELGREQWQRREYENAAISGQMGLKILARENLFPKVKKELEVDLHRLQPYRILELIAQNPVNSPQRNKGLQLLADLLRQRQGIEGRSRSHSGSGFEQFLCFIQQLRTYLTSAEQEELFVREARYASAIGNYLAAYVLMARGYALKQPAAIWRAQNMLETLSQRQDVYWELAVCSLLLGLSPRAFALMQQSKDRSKLDAVRQCSGSSQDLLLGMCVYSEKWLESEVLMQFCDLAHSPITLQAYFDDPQVLSYLEQLAPEASNETTQADPKGQSTSSKIPSRRARFFSRWGKKLTDKVRGSSLPRQRDVTKSRRADRPSQPLATSATRVPNAANGTVKSSSNTPRQGVPVSGTRIKDRGSRNRKNENPPHSASARMRSSTVPPSTVPFPDAVATKSSQPLPPRKRRDRRKPANSTWLVLLFLLGSIFGVGALSFAAMKLFLNRTPQTVESEPQLFISLNRSLLELPPVEAKTSSPQPQPTFADEAEQVVRRWLDSKSAAFGENYQVEKLNEVLIGSLLTAWRDRALSDRQNNIYREYDHELEIESAAVDRDNPQQATVEARVREVARYYQQGNLDDSRSYDDDLLVRYKLVRQGDKWMIAGSEVLEIL